MTRTTMNNEDDQNDQDDEGYQDDLRITRTTKEHKDEECDENDVDEQGRRRCLGRVQAGQWHEQDTRAPSTGDRHEVDFHSIRGVIMKELLRH